MSCVQGSRCQRPSNGGRQDLPHDVFGFVAEELEHQPGERISKAEDMSQPTYEHPHSIHRTSV